MGREEISIHALREEGDPGARQKVPECRRFLSTPSARRATFQAGLLAAHHDISIHALREEGDDNDVDKFIASFDFYPRPPRGGRP